MTNDLAETLDGQESSRKGKFIGIVVNPEAETLQELTLDLRVQVLCNSGEFENNRC